MVSAAVNGGPKRDEDNLSSNAALVPLFAAVNGADGSIIQLNSAPIEAWAAKAPKRKQLHHHSNTVQL